MQLHSILSLASLLSIVTAAPSLPRPGCGQADVIVTGLPPYHPLVIAQGFNPAAVDAALRRDAANVIKAGYNLRVVLMGPEVDISTLGDQMRDHIWEGTGVGYGVRGASRPDLTLRFMDIISTFRVRAPLAPIVFNYSPNTTLWALQERLPLSSDCANSPGKDLGFNVICDICSGPNSTATP